MAICIFENCRKGSLFGRPGRPPIHCSEHKDVDEINLKCKKCTSEGCPSQAYFGTIHQRPIHCGEHRTEGEKNVVMKECAISMCQTRATCGEIGQKPTHCRRHCSSSAVLRVIKSCISEDCHRSRCFGPVGEKPLHCSYHREDDEIDVVSSRCGTQGCSVYDIRERPIGKRISPDGIRMCSHCFRSIHPDLNRLRVRVEHFVLADIQRIIPEMNKYLKIQDCPIPCGVSMERPDALYVVKDGKTLVQIEIDETPDHENDKSRLMRILASTDAVEHIVIRIHTHGTSCIPSMFTKKRLRNGEKVLEARPIEFDRRMRIIEDTIRILLKNNNTCVKELFV